MKKWAWLLGIVLAVIFASCSSETKETHDHAMDGDHHKEMMKEGEMMEEDEMMSEPEVQIIKLEEIDGEFTTKELTLKEGTYSFEVTNNGVDHEVAFVLAPAKEDLQQEDWIKEAMLANAVKDGETSSSLNAVKLEKGEYIYFCPLNPTPHYKLTVE